jgi:hypothetical protein
MNKKISQVIELMHIQIQRGLRKSVNALHALAKNCKKEIEIQKNKYTKKTCNLHCNCHLYKPASTPDIKNDNAANTDSQTQTKNKKRKKNKKSNSQKTVLAATQIQQKINPIQNYGTNTIFYQNSHQIQQEYQRQQLQMYYQTQLQQQYQYELQKQSYLHQQQQQNYLQQQQQQNYNQYHPNRININKPPCKKQPQYNRNLTNTQGKHSNQEENSKQNSNSREEKIDHATLKIMIEDLEDKMSTYVKSVHFDSVIGNLSECSELEKSIFKRQLRIVRELVDPIELE